MKLRALLVDDEDAALVRLRQLCAAHADVRVVGEARTAAEAAERTASLAPDVVFLDVQLGAATGLDVLRALAPEELPNVVFVTAYEHYATDAFEHAAVDYLLKPCSPERFATALERVRRRMAGSLVGPLREELLAACRQLLAGGSADPAGSSSPGASPATPVGTGQGLFVEDGGRFVFLDFTAIDYVEAARNYVVIHVGKATYCHRAAISALEQTLDPARFARIHKSVIVNTTRIASVESDFNGTFVVRLQCGAACRSGPSYRGRIQAWLRPRR